MSEIEKLIDENAKALHDKAGSLWYIDCKSALQRVADAAVKGERERICDWLDGRAKKYEPASSSLVLELASKAIRSEHD